MKNTMKINKKVNKKENITFLSNDYTSKNERHVIKGVPYVSQKTGFFCSYACPTMIFNFFGLNTSLYEVLYNSGVGYALVYPSSNRNYLPIGGTAAAQWSSNRKFLASLYGLSYENWRASRDLSEDKRWQEYLTRILHILKQNIPIQTTVNQLYMPSIQRVIPAFFSNNRVIQSLIFKHLQPGIHDIVLVGFDMKNRKICYHDPQYGVLGSPKEGTYTWVDLENFRKAICSAKIGKKESNYSIEFYKKNPNPSLSKKEIFEIAQKRNIEKMKGNPSVYDERYSNNSLGINALKTLKKDLEEGIVDNSSNILSKFKRTGLRLQLYYKFRDLFLEHLDDNPAFLDGYLCIKIEKEYIFKYLKKNYNLSTNYFDEKRFFHNESELWGNLASIFSFFKQKNLFMQKSDGKNLIKKMSDIIINLIKIENELLDDFKL